MLLVGDGGTVTGRQMRPTGLATEFFLGVFFFLGVTWGAVFLGVTLGLVALWHLGAGVAVTKATNLWRGTGCH